MMLVAALALVAPACTVGANLKSFAPAHQPGGVTVRLSLRSRREVAGELLAVEDSAFLLLAVDRTLVRVPLSVVRSAQAAYGGFVSPLTPWERERIRLASRYPDGVTPELEQHLLAAYRQQAVTMISK